MAISFQNLPEVFLSSADISLDVSRAVKRSELRKLSGALYTRNLTDSLESIVKRNLWPIVGLLFPGTVISHRSALEMRPTDGGTVFLTGSYERRMSLPGLRIRQLKGPGPLDGDRPFLHSLHTASQARAFLEILSTKTVRGSESPALPRKQVEERLESLNQNSGEARANQLRDQARSLALALDAQRAFGELDAIIGSLLRTRQGPLQSKLARARAAGVPFDPFRSTLFADLHSALANHPVVPRYDLDLQGPAFANIAFIDAYFSNFIEGTEFEIAEAREIVFQNRIPFARPDDAHDVIATYQLVGSLHEMQISAVESAKSPDAFIDLLKRRHRIIMSSRPEIHPGEFKTTSNRAGQTVFVAPELVEGTLRHGWEILRNLAEPFARAAFAMFLVAEVHPFDDGNGRLARAMMNAELISGEQRRILIPIVYREDYLLALRSLSRSENPEPVIRMLDRAQEFCAAIDFTNLDNAVEILNESNAFEVDSRMILKMPRLPKPASRFAKPTHL